MTRVDVAARYETVDRDTVIDATRVSVATPAALYRLKKVTVRAKDRQDAARYWAIAPRVYPRGVFNFRNMEEAQRARPTPRPDARRPDGAGAM